MRKQVKHLYEFGPFRIDAGEQTLLRGEETIPLTPKVFETLLALGENCGHVLSKEELMEKVWPASFVEENNLAQNISILRKMLGDGANGVKFIETVPKRGYRFIADVKETLDEDVDLLVHERTKTSVIVEEEFSDAPEEMSAPVLKSLPASSEIIEAQAEPAAHALAQLNAQESFAHVATVRPVTDRRRRLTDKPRSRHRRSVA